MDEAGKLIAELLQKLAQLDHKIWLYRQDMVSEFKKYTDDLLRGVSGDISDTVNQAISESMKNHPSFNLGGKHEESVGRTVAQDTLDNRAHESLTAEPKTLPLPVLPDQGPESPLEGSQNVHEREQEFQGLFTPSYLPLLDSTDRNERRSSAGALSQSSQSKALSIIPHENAPEPTTPLSSSYPPSSSLPSRKPPTTPRRRNTDEASTNSDQSDTPIRRSALRRSSSSTRPQSPRHVRFEFAGEEFPTTSSPILEPHALGHLGHPERVPIILGNGDDTDFGTPLLDDDEIADSPPRKRVSSSEALRALSRGPIDDDGTKWTEVSAPPDGSASVPKSEGESDDSEDEDILSMRPMTVREAAARSNGLGNRTPSPQTIPSSRNMEEVTAGGSQPLKVAKKEDEGDNENLNSFEKYGAIADLAPLQPMKIQTPMTTISAANLEAKYADKSKTVATKSSGKPWFVLPDVTDVGDSPESESKLEVKDDGDDEDEMFTFDESTDRAQRTQESEPESEPESPTEDAAEDVPISQYATSPARGILKLGSLNQSATTTATTSTVSPTAAPSTSNRASYHPFNTPIVSDAVHAQAASLGHVQSFVGSVKDGLDEDALQSFRLGASAGVGSLRGGAPRSLSEKMAFDDAMEAAQRDAGKKRAA